MHGPLCRCLEPNKTTPLPFFFFVPPLHDRLDVRSLYDRSRFPSTPLCRQRLLLCRCCDAQRILALLSVFEGPPYAHVVEPSPVPKLPFSSTHRAPRVGPVGRRRRAHILAETLPPMPHQVAPPRGPTSTAQCRLYAHICYAEDATYDIAAIQRSDMRNESAHRPLDKQRQLAWIHSCTSSLSARPYVSPKHKHA
ncbi:hypothetical protein AB1N83_007628 [Pleurotus pulmonarius]